MQINWKVAALSICIVASTFRESVSKVDDTDGGKTEKWNYVQVRNKAFMFWWLYYTTAMEGYMQKPLILWLQGGPGASGTGFGNFKELGPLDDNLKARKTSWVTQASVLFVDNPVGAGFSYVTDQTAYTTNLDGIASDLLAVMKAFLKEVPDFKKVPFYIFSESYGGKMTAGFAKRLHQAIQNNDIDCNFQGLAMGDSWISPIDSVLTWGPYLYATSVVDEKGLAAINKTAQQTRVAVESGQFARATELWSDTESVLEEVSNNVNFYNILKWGQSESSARAPQPTPRAKDATKKDKMNSLYRRHISGTYKQDLSSLMNGPIKKKLGIIPKNVTWGAQSSMVFEKQAGDFMKPVVDIVDYLLNTSLKVVVYQGQLDLIVDTPGTERWVPKLKWAGLPGYQNAPRKPFYTGGSKMAGFLKSYKNFSFFWVMNAGHMVPADAGEASLEMIKMITT